MKNKRIMLMLLIVLLSFGFVDSLFAVSEEFNGESSQKAVKLLWIPKTWDYDLLGYNIQKGVLNSDTNTIEEWEKVNEEIFTASLSDNRNWDDVHYSSAIQKELRDNVLPDAVIKWSTWNITADQFRDKLKEINFSGMRIDMRSDFNYALALGFACAIKRDTIEPGTFYGLFPVYESAGQLDSPIAVYEDKIITSLSSKLDFDVDFKDSGKTIGLSWDRPLTDLDEFGTYEVEVYQVIKASGTSSSELVHLGQAFRSINDEEISFKAVSKKCDTSVSQKFKFVAHNYFQTVLKEVSLTYEPELTLGEELEIEEKPVVTQLRGTGINISWDFKDSKEELIQGFIVKRRYGVSIDFEDVSGLLGPDQRSFTILDETNYGQLYTYSILVVGTDGEITGYPYVTILLMDNRIPPIPSNFVSEFITKDDKRFVKLTWDDKSEDDDITYSYRLVSDYTDKDKFKLYGPTGNLKETEYLFEVSNWFGRSYSFKLQSISINSIESDFVSTTCYVPGGYMPAFESNPKAEWYGSGDSVKISWDYNPGAKTEDQVLGYRVYLDGELVADESEVSADKDEWIISDLKADTRYNIALEVVGVDDILSIRKAYAAWKTPRNFGIPEKPQNFSASKIQMNGQPAIRFKWDKCPKKESWTYRYQLLRQTDDGKWEKIKEFGRSSDGFDYVYPKDMEGKSANFKLVGLTQGRFAKGKHSEAVVDLSSEK